MATVSSLTTEDSLVPGAFSKLPSTKVVSRIFKDLPLQDAQNSRLVCREWNFAITEILSFAVKLSDMTILPFLRIRRPEPIVPKLNVVKIIVSDLSSLSAPFSPEALQEQLKCPKNVHSLHFLEGVSLSVKQNFLLAFKWIHTLKFEKTPVPTFPEGLMFPHLTTFEMSPGAYNESDELKIFFHNTFFPALTDTCIQIHCRSDYLLYAAAHFFISRHHRTLKHVKLLFLESLTMISCYDTEIYAKDFQAMILDQKRHIEEQPEYEIFLKNDHFSQLETLNLWLIDNEEFLKLSLRLIEVQTNLVILDINHPYAYRNIQSDFSLVIRNNWRTLKKITIPRLPQFDCQVLKDCIALEEFSLGMEFSFYDFENFGSVINVQDFPSLPTIQSVSMGSPISREEIYWMLTNIPAKTFLFIGSLSGNEDGESGEYSLSDVKGLIESPGLVPKKALMMCIPMTHSTFKHFEMYLNKNSEIGVRVIYHCKASESSQSGTAHFSIYYGHATCNGGNNITM